MASGIYGTVKAANIDPSRDVQILYHYRPTRGTSDDSFEAFKELDASTCLINSTKYIGATDEKEAINGLFDLRLPLANFNKKGFYTIYIRPKEINATIFDVSVLSSYPSVKGVVFEISQGSELYGLTDLTGYRIDYSNGDSRLIKSSNPCIPVVSNNGDGYPKTTRYELTDSSTGMIFCTLAPSSSPTFKPNAFPYIGEPQEKVLVVNTLFSPKMVEVEMVDHDADTISYMLEGDQVRDKDNAIITTYNDDKDIYKQYDYYTVKDKLGVPLYDVKKERKNIDNSQIYDNIPLT